MVKTSKEYVASHRARKAALAFSAEYIEGKLVCTPQEFVQAKEREFCQKHNIVSPIEFNDSLYFNFYKYLKQKDHQEGGAEYTIDGLMCAWKRAIKEADS